jgi:hypothetical protein
VIAACLISRVSQVEHRHDDCQQRTRHQGQNPGADAAPEHERDHRH